MGVLGIDADRVDRPVRADAAGQVENRLDGILALEVDRFRSLARAIASRSSSRSTAMTRPAPITRAEAMANWPTGPQPNTATV